MPWQCSNGLPLRSPVGAVSEVTRQSRINSQGLSIHFVLVFKKWSFLFQRSIRGAHNVTASAPKTRLPGAPSIFSLLPFSALTSRFTLSHIMPVCERREGERQWRKKRPTTEKLLIGRFAFLPSVCLLPKNERARWKLAAMFKNLSSSFYWVRSACSSFAFCLHFY